jgi:hypothetical protein
LVGLLLFLLWVATDHNAAANNLNLLWAIPTHLIVIILLLKKHKPSWTGYYFLATAIASVLLISIWGILPQTLHYSLMPFVALISLRAFYIYYWLKKFVHKEI